ncbi:MAG TPA: EamA family transporter [Candidatus Limnocylindrales bacterium]|jgi:drug/metabolite transporter (DMT)-like permease
MPPLALGLALLAAFLHASWNLLLRRTDDTEASTALMVCTGCVVLSPLMVVTWSVQAAVIPYLLATWTFELIYFVLLAAAYRRAELSLVYPLARGSAPVIVLVVGVALLGVQPTVAGGLGVLLVGAGVLLVRGLRGGGDTVGALLALATAAAIAGYTLVDRVGVTLAGAVTYLELAMIVPGVLYLLAVIYLRGHAYVRAQFRPSTVVAGTLMISAYGLVLLALRLAPAASVAAVRESGVVMATAMAAVLLHERVSRERFAGAVLVVVGIAALAVS